MNGLKIKRTIYLAWPVVKDRVLINKGNCPVSIPKNTKIGYTDSHGNLDDFLYFVEAEIPHSNSCMSIVFNKKMMEQLLERNKENSQKRNIDASLTPEDIERAREVGWIESEAKN